MTDSSAPKKMLVKQVLLKQDRKKEEDNTFEQIAFERETRMVEKENTHPTHPTNPTPPHTYINNLSMVVM